VSSFGTRTGQEDKGSYDVAQVCLNGHVTNETFRSSPEFNKAFCDWCGEKTITECPNCNAEIQGFYHGSELFRPPFHPPSYCCKCGKPFPWTDLKIQAAIELGVEAGGLNDEDANEFRESVNDIVRDTPRAQLAVNRFRRIMDKVGPQVATGIRKLLVDVASEAAKKLLLGP